MKLLLTGGLGYVGSHAAAALAAAGHGFVLYDNLSRGRPEMLQRLQSLTGRPQEFIRGDVRDTALLARAMSEHGVDAVMHFAGLKVAPESFHTPLDYYANNVQGSISLMQAMEEVGVRTLVFSSSAAVYGTPRYAPVDEAHPLNPASPYGRNKQQVEAMLADLAAADKSWRIACLRYFNPVGAHESGLIGEDPTVTPGNLMPRIIAAAGGGAPVDVFGRDYETADGTGVRDYVHVMDVAEGHVAALEYLLRQPKENFSAVNLGTGRGYSVLEMIAAFERVTGASVPYIFADRRQGDVAACYADAGLATRLLGWRATRGIEAMCQSAWEFYRQNAGVRTHVI